MDAVSDGQIAAVETDAGVFVRYLYHMGDRILLVPASGGYPPLSVPATTPSSAAPTRFGRTCEGLIYEHPEKQQFPAHRI